MRIKSLLAAIFIIGLALYAVYNYPMMFVSFFRRPIGYTYYYNYPEKYIKFTGEIMEGKLVFYRFNLNSLDFPSAGTSGLPDDLKFWLNFYDTTLPFAELTTEHLRSSYRSASSSDQYAQPIPSSQLVTDKIRASCSKSNDEYKVEHWTLKPFHYYGQTSDTPFRLQYHYQNQKLYGIHLYPDIPPKPTELEEKLAVSISFDNENFIKLPILKEDLVKIIGKPEEIIKEPIYNTFP